MARLITPRRPPIPAVSVAASVIVEKAAADTAKVAAADTAAAIAESRCYSIIIPLPGAPAGAFVKTTSSGRIASVAIRSSL